MGELREALARVKTLRGLLPVCARCHRCATTSATSKQLESYLAAHGEAQFSHGMCPECCQRHLSGSGGEGE